MMRQCFNLINSSNEKIHGDLRFREGVKNASTIIICHGFKGFKDWGFFPFVGERFAEDGYVSIIFNFSRNGIGSDPNSFTELDKFAENTYTNELNDLQCLIDSICLREIGKGLIDVERLALLGHSRGGGIAILQASTDERIQALATWSSIARVDRYSENVLKEWGKNGYIEIENKRTKQMMRINKVFIDDIQKNKKKLNILKATAQLEIPALVVHGDNDESVSVSEAKEIFDQMGGFGKELEIIEGGTHTFGVGHPMESPSTQFETVLDLTESFFDKNLNLL
ncbi:alpha/beta hydrolase [Calditrichota bacterium]